jgi:hypothetical protein
MLSSTEQHKAKAPSDSALDDNFVPQTSLLATQSPQLNRRIGQTFVSPPAEPGVYFSELLKEIAFPPLSR